MDATMTRESLERIIRSGMRRIKSTDLGRIVGRSRTLKRLIRGPLADIASDISVLFELVQDYVHGRYREAPKRTVFAAAAALLYVLNPFDLIPDFIPGLGYVDDAAVVMLVIRSIRADLDDYRSWSQKLAKRLRHLTLAI
jgi:uncharacterized membrane protein YkvA (DUF1232 family)